MLSKKKKYNARFPAGRIKKIMQTDEDVGKVAQAVPVIISRALELFVESLLTKAMEITSAKNAKTLTPSHMKQCILSESRFDFLKDLVNNISDVSACDDTPTTPQPSGISAPFPNAHKREGGTTRGRGRGSGASRNSAAPRITQLTSLHIPPASRPQNNAMSSHPGTPTTPSTPSFYRELPISANDGESIRQESVIRPPVIQHTANHRPLSNDSGDEEVEGEESDEENGYGELSNHSSNHLFIDEDYDT